MEANDGPQQPRPAVARPATVTMKAHFPQGSVELRPNLWHNWARLAMKAEARAVAALRNGHGADDVAPYVEVMTLETMIAVTAVRSSFHHLYLDWHGLLGLRPRGDEKKVPGRATTDIPGTPHDRKAWFEAIKKLIDDRDRIIHKAQDSQRAVAHPLGASTSPLDAYFISDLATAAVDTMLDFYGRVITSPTPALAEWADKSSHVYHQLRDLRKCYHDDEYGG